MRHKPLFTSVTKDNYREVIDLIGAEAKEDSDRIALEACLRGGATPALAVDREGALAISALMRLEGASAASAAKVAYERKLLLSPTTPDVTRKAIRLGLVPGVTSEDLHCVTERSLRLRPEDAEVYASLIKGRGLTVARAAAVAREEGLVANPVSGNTLRKAVRKGDVPGVTEETLPKAPAGAGGGIASVVPGREFGKWRVVRLDRAHRSGSGHACAYCACSCGTERWVDVYHLLGGKSRSCGRCGTRGSVLGSKSELYGVYHSVVDRCSKSNNAAYRWYGARGTTVCDEWGSYANFERWALEQGWEEGANLSVERLDNGRGYSPDNCTLIPRSDQRFNRRSNRRVEYKGVELEVSRWSQITGIPNRVILSRLNSGWTPERALETKYVPRKRTEAPSA